MEAGARTPDLRRSHRHLRSARNWQRSTTSSTEHAAAVQRIDGRDATQPAVIVGHSIGSLILRVFAGRYPDRIAGMVHVDGSIPRRRLFQDVGEANPPDGDGPDATEFDSEAGEVEALNAEASWPDVPAAVVTRTLDRWTHGYSAERADPVWSAYQRQLARLLHCPLVIARDAGHQIPAEAPGLVAYVVDQVVEAARSWSTPALDDIAAAGGQVSY